MKKIIYAVFVIGIMLLAFSGCTEKNTSEEATSEESQSAESTSITIEDISHEVKPIDFEIPDSFDDLNEFLDLPEYSSSKKASDGEEFYDNNGVKLMKKTYTDQGKDSSITIYEEDGNTVKSVFNITYGSAPSLAVENYIAGECHEKFKFSFDSTNRLTMAFHLVLDENSMFDIIDGYSFDEQGNILEYYNYDDIQNAISGILVDSLLNGL